MVIRHLKCAARNAERATTRLSLANLGIFILFLAAIIFFYPICAKADDLDQKIVRIVKSFQQQIGDTESGNKFSGQWQNDKKQGRGTYLKWSKLNSKYQISNK